MNCFMLPSYIFQVYETNMLTNQMLQYCGEFLDEEICLISYSAIYIVLK